MGETALADPDGVMARIASSVDHRGPDECWPWTGKVSADGFVRVNVKTADGRWLPRLTHRLIFESSHGRLPEGRSVRFSCEDRTCCNPAHLALSPTECPCGAAVEGRSVYCADCRAERRRASARKHYEANRETIKARSLQRQRLWRHIENRRYHERYRTKRMAQRYGVSIAEMEKLLAVVVCAICGRDDRPMVTDHDHDSGEVRGRLCQNCNRAIGLLGDDPDVLLAAAAYLRESKA